MDLTNEELKRYKRQIILPEIGINGQAKLHASKVLIVGIGGLGCPAALYLAAAGVGHLGLADADFVDISNLQRQALFTEEDVGKLKVDAAESRLRKFNSAIEIKKHPFFLDEENAEKLAEAYDIVVDCTDSFIARSALNAACVRLNKLYVYGSVEGFEGQVSVFRNNGPCLQCIFPMLAEGGRCSDVGVIGVLPGIIGLLQATETIKLILGVGSSLSGRLLLFNGLDMQFREFKINKNPKCACCRNDIKRNADKHDMVEEIAPKELKELLNKKKAVLIDVREEDEHMICNIAGAKLIPMSELQERINEIPKDREVVLYCHHGRRSMHAAQHLLAIGWKKIKSLKGGIDKWAEDVEPEMERY